MVVTWTVVIMSMSCIYINGEVLTYESNCNGVTYSAAVTACADNGLVLAQPKTDKMWQTVRTLVTNDCSSSAEIHLGLAYNYNLQKYVWNDGDTLDELDWNAWKIGDPVDPSNNPCMRARIQNNDWRSRACTFDYGFVCQSSSNPMPAESTSVVTTQYPTTTEVAVTSTESFLQPATTEGPRSSTESDVDPATTGAPPAPTNGVAPVPQISHDSLFHLAMVDYVPDVALLYETTTRSTLSCAAKCSELNCVLFAVGSSGACKLYEQPFTSWIPDPGALVYTVH